VSTGDVSKLGKPENVKLKNFLTEKRLDEGIKLSPGNIFNFTTLLNMLA